MKPLTHRTVSILGAVACALALLFGAVQKAPAHDDAQWIQDRWLRNQAGEWCCGPGDCEPIAHDRVTLFDRGYRLDGGAEAIPFSEVLPLSIDGRLWICRRRDGSRRCTIGPRSGV